MRTGVPQMFRASGTQSVQDVRSHALRGNEYIRAPDILLAPSGSMGQPGVLDQANNPVSRALPTPFQQATEREN